MDSHGIPGRVESSEALPYIGFESDGRQAQIGCGLGVVAPSKYQNYGSYSLPSAPGFVASQAVETSCGLKV